MGIYHGARVKGVRRVMGEPTDYRLEPSAGRIQFFCIFSAVRYSDILRIDHTRCDDMHGALSRQNDSFPSRGRSTCPPSTQSAAGTGTCKTQTVFLWIEPSSPATDRHAWNPRSSTSMTSPRSVWDPPPKCIICQTGSLILRGRVRNHMTGRLILHCLAR